jgi:hypothetical protein
MRIINSLKKTREKKLPWRKDFASSSGSPEDRTIKLAEESGLE